jgi:hypothetical protein
MKRLASTKHFTRWVSLEQRFEAKVDRSPGHGPWGDCHIWLAALHADGYGLIKVNGRYEMAHRVAYGLDLIPVGHDVHHRCEIRPCVNREHLIPRLHEKHPHEHRGTHCKHGHRLEGENIYVRPDNGRRACAACRDDRNRKRKRGANA